ncbi:UDP-glycosyltransferase 82A1-like [Oryza brachyantha]|uniref:UDP-glycosyltransferase 82A1-like n=1 Tax=Oryza brachyantha TaxID=4533 RepID=UPI001ADA48B6|nr:UDP-glycosyltransferase 82A1-like [Oryza brachyantha]
MGAEAIHEPPAVLLVPFPAQGHVTPMLHLARALAAHGVAATVAVPDFIHRRIAAAGGGRARDELDGGVGLASIPSGIALPEGGGAGRDADPPGFGAIVHAMEHHMPAHLERMLQPTGRRHRRVAWLVVDVLASWAVPVAERCGVPAAGFWPAMLASYRAVAAIPELLGRGVISESGTPAVSSNHPDNDGGQEEEQQQPAIRGMRILPAELELSTKELPWLVGDSATQRSRFAFWLQTLHRARGFRTVLVNSFPGEAASAAAAEVDDDDDGKPVRQGPRVLPVGPLLAGGNVERAKGGVAAANDDNTQQPCSKNPSMWQADSTCIRWLDAQPAASVVYVSFGSWVGPIGHDKIRELALGLEATGRPFLWALKDDPSWRAGLPGGYAGRVAGRGKLVEWAPQDEVLRHAAVGCYLTHCGWNSTVEAIQHGVRMLCHPVAGDQFINCAYITRVWKVGLRLGSVSQDGVKSCIERVMEGAEGARLQEKMNTLRQRVVTAEARRMAQRNVKSFVSEIMRDYPSLMQMYTIL